LRRLGKHGPEPFPHRRMEYSKGVWRRLRSAGLWLMTQNLFDRMLLIESDRETAVSSPQIRCRNPAIVAFSRCRQSGEVYSSLLPGALLVTGAEVRWSLDCKQDRAASSARACCKARNNLEVEPCSRSRRAWSAAIGLPAGKFSGAPLSGFCICSPWLPSLRRQARKFLPDRYLDRISRSTDRPTAPVAMYSGARPL